MTELFLSECNSISSCNGAGIFNCVGRVGGGGGWGGVGVVILVRVMLVVLVGMYFFY